MTMAPSATAARYRGSGRWPTAAVSTMPSSGTDRFERISGQASRQHSRNARKGTGRPGR